MKQVITLESKELKAIEGLSPEEVDRKIKALLEK